MPKRFSFAFNWRKSTPHMLFLQTFLKMRPANEHPPLPGDSNWHALLEEPPEKAIERFLVQRALVRASLSERLDYHFKATQLKEMARRRELPVSGRKDELIARLIQSDEAGMYQDVPRTELLQCSDYGRRQIEEFMANPTTITRLKDKKWAVAAVAVLSWVVLEALLPELIGSAAYDLLTQIDAPAARGLKQYRPQIGATKYTYVTSALKLEWCFVPAGYFWLGSADNDPDAIGDEKPQHRIYLPAYYLGKYPITNQQYQVFVQSTGHRKPGHWENGRIPRGQADHPATYVYWSDTVAFCQWAARVSGVPIRLLTEAEWEKGARGEKGYRYPWGNTWYSGYSNSENKEKGTTPVGHYPRGASPYGAHDMVGNVWEWTSSLYRPYPYRADDGRENMDAEGSRVIRGGSWYSDSKWARAAYRHRRTDYYWYVLGFRVGWSAPFSPLL